MTAVADYPFTEEWKAKQDKAGPQWMAYCEVSSLVRKFNRACKSHGRDFAEACFEDYLEKVQTHRKGTSAQDLREAFNDVLAHEGSALV